MRESPQASLEGWWQVSGRQRQQGWSPRPPRLASREREGRRGWGVGGLFPANKERDRLKRGKERQVSKQKEYFMISLVTHTGDRAESRKEVDKGNVTVKE